MKKLSSIVLFCALIFSCQKNDTLTSPQKNIRATSAPADRAVLENSRDVPVDAVFFNACCNEDVHATGLAHLVISGNVIHLEVTGISGTGLSTGFHYTAAASVQTNVFYSNQYEGILTSITNMHNDAGCSFILKSTFKAEANANGELVVAFQKFEALCH